MAQRKAGFDKLHDDAMREIFIRVAGQPDGATDIARTFCVCKGFHKFSKDKGVLRAVVLDNLSVSRRCEPYSSRDISERTTPGFDYLSTCSKYEPFQQAGGLINMCAQAGHPDAELILAKIIMVSAAQILNTTKLRLFPEVSFDGSEHREDITKVARAASFLAHFSAEKTGNNMIHLDWVRLYLSRGTYIELEDMRHVLIDFVEYYLRPGVVEHHDNFLYLLDDLWQNRIMMVQSAKSLILVGLCNNICQKGREILLAVGADQQLVDALELLMLPKDHHFTSDYENLIGHFVEIENIIREGMKEKSVCGDIAEDYAKVIEGASTVKDTFASYNLLSEYVEQIRELLLYEFDALFSI